MLARLRRIFHTLRYLQPRQAFFYVWRRGIGMRCITPWQKPLQLRSMRYSPVQSSLDTAPIAAVFQFTFLNQTLEFARDQMNWSPTAANRLWRYNLHYFDFLHDQQRSLREKLELIQHWIDHNPQGSQPAWEPYTASLRIVNWCKFFSSLENHSLQDVWLRSLYDQTRWLERNLEHHILANHLFENIKALLFAGAFFADDNSARWLRYGQTMLREQLREQTLDDGGHYERSPQYHCILLEDHLDLFFLAKKNPGLFSEESIRELSGTISAELKLLGNVATPDDNIPLFNDSASGIAAKPSAIIQRATELGFDAPKKITTGGQIIDLPTTGLYGWKNARDYFVIDCGDIGPNYQPGHTHCDFLSYVLMIDGQWLIVDSGVCEYEPGEMRRYVRSTRAHNTVTIDDADQSEVWGEFRVGRRARRIEAKIERTQNGVEFAGAFRGFPTISGGITHRRVATLRIDEQGKINQITIADNVQGGGVHRICSLIHIHPEIDVQILRDEIRLCRKSGLMATIKVDTKTEIKESTHWYCYEFGNRLKNPVIELSTTENLPCRIGYTIVF